TGRSSFRPHPGAGGRRPCATPAGSKEFANTAPHGSNPSETVRVEELAPARPQEPEKEAETNFVQERPRLVAGRSHLRPPDDVSERLTKEMCRNAQERAQ